MAHMIDMSNNRANIAFVGQTPWHGLGVNLDQNSSIETWLVSAGLNWEAQRTKIMFETTEGLKTGNSDVIYRSDTFKEIGVVTERYKIVQPKEVLEFYRDLVATQNWTIDVAGSLDGGKRIWALAKTNAGFNVAGTTDRVDTYLLLATSFDGTMATVGKFTSVRVVCQNTMTLSLNDKTARVAIPHSRIFNADSVKKELGIYEDATALFNNRANALANRKVSDSDALTFIKNVIAGEETKIDDLSTRSANIVKSIFDKFKGGGYGATLSSAEGTLWGAFNAITEYNTHDVGNTNNNRLRSNWFGLGEKTSLNAMDLELEML